MEKLTAKNNIFADLKEFAAAQLGKLAGQMEARATFAFAGNYLTA